MINIFYGSSFSLFLDRIEIFFQILGKFLFQVYGFLKASKTFSGLKKGIWIVLWDNEMVLNTIIFWILASFFLNLQFFPFFASFCPFLSLTTLTVQRNYQVLQMDYLTELQRQKMVLNGFCTAKSGNSSFKYCTFLLFFYQGPGNFLLELIISCCIVFKVNGMVINILMTPISDFIW